MLVFLKYKNAFTLLEVLIAIALLSLVMLGLNGTVTQLRESNKHLLGYLNKSKSKTKGIRVLYMDILQSNGDIKIYSKNEFHRLIINSTKNSLFGLYNTKVAWLVYKEKNTLLRVENGAFSIPFKTSEEVGINNLSENIEIFKVYKSKNKNQILVILKVKGEKSQEFLVDEITKFADNKNNKSIIHP